MIYEWRLLLKIEGYTDWDNNKYKLLSVNDGQYSVGCLVKTNTFEEEIDQIYEGFSPKGNLISINKCIIFSK